MDEEYEPQNKQEISVATPERYTCEQPQNKQEISVATPERYTCEQPQNKQEISVATPERYTCEQCSFTTEHRYRLRIHIHNQHTVLAKTKPLVCKYCSYRTHYTTNLNNHMRTHTGEKPFACRFCGRSFAARSNLKSHESIHTGFRRRICPYPHCQYNSNRVDAIKAHMARYHPESEVSLPVSAADSRPLKIWTGVHGDSGQHYAPGRVASDCPSTEHSLVVAETVSALSVVRLPSVSLSTFPEFHGAGGNDQLMESDNSSECIDVKPFQEDLVPFVLVGSSEDETDAPLCDDEDMSDRQSTLPQVSVDVKNKSDIAVNGVDCKRTLSQSDAMHDVLDTSSSGVAVNKRNMQHERSGPAMEHFAQLLGDIIQDNIDTSLIVNILVQQGKLHRCQHCNIIFPEYSTYVLHRGCHGNDSAFQCHFCQAVFGEKFGFMTHFMQCLKKRPAEHFAS